MGIYDHLTYDEQVEMVRRRIDSIENCDGLFSDAERKEDERELFFGSHMDERHSGLSEEDLIHRMLHDKITGASTYDSPEVAHEIVREFLWAEADKIVHFTNMSNLDQPVINGKKLEIETEIMEGKPVKKLICTGEIEAEDPEMHPFAGKGITNDFRFMGSNTSKMVIVKASMNELGFRVLTCMPDVHKGTQLEPRSATLAKVNKLLLEDRELSPAQKTMWLYRQKGYHSSVSKNGYLFVRFQHGQHTFSMALSPYNSSYEPKVSLVKTLPNGKTEHIKLEDATKKPEVIDMIMKKAKGVKAEIYDRAMNGKMKEVCDEIVANERKQERDTQNRDTQNRNDQDIG